jgi:phenylacetate-coenzyme A ligase PaaK-like adenylate-forming protein
VLFLASSDPELADKLAAFRPTVLTATPTTLDLLAARPDPPRLPSLRQVVTTSEALTDAARGRIGAAFGAPVLDTYAMGECLFLTTGCPAGPGSHVNADWAVLEVVDEANRPVPPGRVGHKVLLTNLANATQPLIRYEVGDRVQMAAVPCRCGSRLPRVARVQGRAAEFFWVRAGAGYRPLTMHPFQHAFEHFRGVREWQATQRGRNRILVRFELLPGAELNAEQVRRRLDERLGLTGLAGVLDGEFEVVPRLAADPGTGKFRRLVSLVGVPDDLDQPRVPAELAVGRA